MAPHPPSLSWRTMELSSKPGNFPNFSLVQVYSIPTQLIVYLGGHQMVVPDSDIGGPKGIAGWVKQRLGVHFLYRPVVITFDCRDTVTEFELTDEMVALIL